MDLYGYLVIFRRRLWVLLTLPMAAALTAAILSYFVLTPVYQATTTLLVVRRDAIPLDMGSLTFNRSLVKTYGQLVKSRSVLERAITLGRLNDSVGDLQSRVQVNTVEETEIMTISVEDSDPARVARTADTVAEAFIFQAQQLVKVENVRVVDPAVVPTVPISPRKLMNVAIGFSLGLMVAIGLSLLIEALDRSIKDSGDAERLLHLPVIGAIPIFRLVTEGTYGDLHGGTKAGWK